MTRPTQFARLLMIGLCCASMARAAAAQPVGEPPDATDPGATAPTATSAEPATPSLPAPTPQPQPFPATEPAPPPPVAEPPAAEPPVGDTSAAVTHDSRLVLLAQAGLGAGSIAFERPIRDGSVQRLPETAALIVTVALRAERELSSFAALAVQLRYATSLGLTVEEPGLYALPTELGARVERVELSAAPVLGFFGKGERAPRLALPLGFVLDSFAPDVREQGVPSYSLSGLLLRAELIVPVLDRITVQLGPDASWLLAVDGSIRGDGTEGTGFALGVEASLRLELSAHLGLELHLRQSIAKAPGAVDAPGFEQRMRLATLSLAGAL